MPSTSGGFSLSLRKSFRRKSELWPGRYDPALLKNVHSVRDFDEHITARYMGFAGAADYYDKASSSHVLDRIAVPTLVIHSDDDPFVVMSAESQRKLMENPNVTFLHTTHGGHCAFICRAERGWARRRTLGRTQDGRISGASGSLEGWVEMDADYSVELGPEAPALEIPWHDPEGRLHYVELRSDSGSMDRDILNDPRLNDVLLNVARIPEARQFPALGRFLIAVNSPRAPWQTAKCDVWPDEAEAAENLYNRSFEQSCYVDIVLAEQAAALRFSLEVHERLARELAQLLEANEALEATAEIVVRRCYFHRRR